MHLNHLQIVLHDFLDQLLLTLELYLWNEKDDTVVLFWENLWLFQTNLELVDDKIHNNIHSETKKKLKN